MVPLASPWPVRLPVPGLLLAVGVAAVATGLGELLPIVGGPVFGIVLGAALAAVVPRHERLDPGLQFARSHVLQASIVLLGTGLSLSQVVHVGATSLPVLAGTLTVALVGARLVGAALGVPRDARTLIGVGTGVCGASAIAAITPVLGAAEADVAYAIGTIFTFNVAGVLLFPAVGHLLGLSQHAFGLWSGTAINDTSSVVAAAYSYGATAGAYAVVVNLTRSLAIIPITVGLALLRGRRSGADGRLDGASLARLVPLFLVGFVATSAAQTAGVIPAGWHPALGHTAVFCITVALAAIGLSTRLSTLRQAGHRPLLLGAVLWAAVGVSSLLLQAVTGTL